MRFQILLALIFLTSLGFSCTPLGQTDVPITLSSPGDYCLTEAIDGSGYTAAVTLESSDVIFDCQGYSISGTDVYGIYTPDIGTQEYSNVSIQNCTIHATRPIRIGDLNNASLRNIITDGSYGIEVLQGFYNSVADNINVVSTIGTGFFTYWVENSSISNITSVSEGNGIEISEDAGPWELSNVTMSNFQGTSNTGIGIMLHSLRNSSLTYASGTSVNYIGVMPYQVSDWAHGNNRLSFVNATGYLYGLFIQDSALNASNVNVYASTGNAIQIYYAENVTLKDCTSTTVGASIPTAAIYSQSPGATIINCDLDAPYEEGVYLDLGSDNTKIINTTIDSLTNGVYSVTNSGTEVIGSTITAGEQGVMFLSSPYGKVINSTITSSSGSEAAVYSQASQYTEVSGSNISGNYGGVRFNLDSDYGSISNSNIYTAYAPAVFVSTGTDYINVSGVTGTSVYYFGYYADSGVDLRLINSSMLSYSTVVIRADSVTGLSIINTSAYSILDDVIRLSACTDFNITKVTLTNQQGCYASGILTTTSSGTIQDSYIDSASIYNCAYGINTDSYPSGLTTGVVINNVTILSSWGVVSTGAVVVENSSLIAVGRNLAYPTCLIEQNADNGVFRNNFLFGNLVSRATICVNGNGNVFTGNNITGSMPNGLEGVPYGWIDSTGANIFNDSTHGNIYYSGDLLLPAWEEFNISCTTPAPCWATEGDLPFSAALMPLYWAGTGEDYRPYTLNTSYTPPPPTPSQPSSASILYPIIAVAIALVLLYVVLQLELSIESLVALFLIIVIAISAILPVLLR